MFYSSGTTIAYYEFWYFSGLCLYRNIAYQIVHEIEEVDTTRRWLLAYSTFSFFTANFFWVFHLSKENCRNDSNFYPSILALVLNCIYMVFFWYKASGRNPSRENLLYSALFLVGAIVTSCLVGTLLDSRLAGGFGIFFYCSSSSFRVVGFREQLESYKLLHYIFWNHWQLLNFPQDWLESWVVLQGIIF